MRCFLCLLLSILLGRGCGGIIYNGRDIDSLIEIGRESNGGGRRGCLGV